MKQYSKKLFSLVVLCSTAVMLQADNDNNGNQVIPFIQFRSQGRDMARKLYGQTSYAIYQGDMDDNYGTFDVTVQYDQSFRSKNLARALFGASLVNNPAVPVTTTNSCNKNCNNSCDETLIISGLANSTRAATDWMAENFYLPRDFKSAISFNPKVQDVVVNFDFYYGLDRWVKGMYFRLYGPVAWNKTSLRAEETIINTTPVVGYSEGYFDADVAVPASALFQSALPFFGGCQLPAYTGQSVVAAPLKFAKFSDCNLPGTTNNNNNCNNECNGFNHHKTGFAELRGEFGWNYMAEKYRLMLNVQAAAPTGTRPNAEFLFPAQVGNGKHWELGVGLGGSWKMWGSEDGEKSFNFIVEADITHLFKAKQRMTFDLKCKPNSRYMLAEQLVAITDVAEQLIPNTPQFDITDDGNGIYTPVANFSTRDVKVGFGVQGDVVAMFNYTVRGFSWDLGYNFWGLSSSEISLSCDDNCSNNNNSCDLAVVPFPTNMALKGDASIAGYNSVDGVTYGLGATESKATIFTGTNVGLTASALSNPGIDSPIAANGNDGAGVSIPLFVSPGVPTVNLPINTSSAPVFISINDLDLEGAEQRAITNRVFTHFSYTWLDRDKWQPYVGAGFSAEFGSNNGNDDCPATTTTTCNTCPSSLSVAVSKWAVEIKGGVSFH